MRNLLYVYSILFFLASCELPSDQAMIRSFEKNRALLDEVVVYFKNNADIKSISYQSEETIEIQYTDGVRKKTTNAQLEKILDTLDFRRVWRSANDTSGSIYLEYDLEMHGLGPEYSKKGFAYLLTPPQRESLIGSLDDLPDVSRPPMYRHLQDNWYIFFQYIGG